MVAGPVSTQYHELNEVGLFVRQCFRKRGEDLEAQDGPAEFLAGYLDAAGYGWPNGRTVKELREMMTGAVDVDALLPGQLVETLDLDDQERGDLAYAVAYGQRRARP